MLIPESRGKTIAERILREIQDSNHESSCAAGGTPYASGWFSYVPQRFWFERE